MTISAVIRRTAAVAPWALACLACVSEPAAPAGPSSAPAVAGRGSALATVPAEDALASLAGDWVVRREVVGADGASAPEMDWSMVPARVSAAVAVSSFTFFNKTLSPIVCVVQELT
ncbi:MAG: hypothetical protein QF410_04810, partial [Planctomycetota bacterium]|nr:hypothetical protein [Planctomycetota bacterium]